MKVILIVDDEYDIVSSLDLTFTLEGYQVLSAFNGREALAHLQNSQRPDLVISDLMMPELDGYGLLHALRADPATLHLPVILMSAAPLDESRAPRGTWNLFVRKPFNLDRFIGQVQAILSAAPAPEKK